MNHFSYSDSDNKRMDRYFFENSMGFYVPPGSVKSGFVFTNLDQGTKTFNVDLISEDNQIWTFTFFIPVPGIKVDHHQVDWENLYPEDAIVTHDEESLRRALESLPCCTTNKDGTEQGDPLNLVVIGEGEDVHYSFLRSGWDETEILSDSSKRGAKQSSARRYRYAPIGALYVFGRPQDGAFGP